MVRGLARFREWFRAYAGQYVLIGGAACDLLSEEAGLEFRATKDLDIVLCVEALDASFVRAFWEFVRNGGYEIQEGASGERRYYRFQKPRADGYPPMLELFARKPDMLELAEDSHLTPIPVDEEVSSLSAILLDDTYYAFLHSGRVTIDGVPVAGAEQLIALKARAWLDLTARRRAGEKIDSRSIAKHRNDVFRLYRILDPTFTANVPPAIGEDIRAFLDAVSTEPVDLKSLGITDRNLDAILAELRELYVRG